MPAIRRRWTTADVRALMDESRAWPRYELIDGELLVTPAPGNPHQVVVLDVARILADYMDRLEIGVVYVSPADLELLPDTISQPDVFVVPRMTGPPDGEGPGWAHIKSLLLAVEVLSPGSIRHDRVIKRDHYMGAGVPDYWIVDVDARVFERWQPQQEHPTILRDEIVWQPAEASYPLRINLQQFFDTLAKKLRMVRI